MEETTIYALGFFDGIHRGHGALLAACRKMADSRGCKAGAVTFSGHPAGLVRGEAPSLITTVRERERLMKEEFHMDTVVTLPFDARMRAMPWQDFLTMLRREHGAVGFVCGDDFRFGYRGQGNAVELKGYCEREKLPCTVVAEQLVDGKRLSSTAIRALLEAGDMEQARKLLGHPYSLTGSVVHGQRLGRRLGIPTANLLLPPELVTPPFGVYACRCYVDGEVYLAVTNIGTRPTVSGSGVTVEPWILDFEGDLYGRELRLEFYKFLRPELKFPDLTAMQQEIRKNAAETRRYFEGSDCHG